MSLSADDAFARIRGHTAAEEGSTIDQIRGSVLTGGSSVNEFWLKRNLLSVSGYYSPETTFIAGGFPPARRAQR